MQLNECILKFPFLLQIPSNTIHCIVYILSRRLFGDQDEQKIRMTNEEENLSDLCERSDGVAEVVVNVQPGRRCSGLPRGVWRRRGQETCDP